MTDPRDDLIRCLAERLYICSCLLTCAAERLGWDSEAVQRLVGKLEEATQ